MAIYTYTTTIKEIVYDQGNSFNYICKDGKIYAKTFIKY